MGGIRPRLRFESSRASAANSDGKIDWTGVTPRVMARARPFPKDRPHLVTLAGYAEYLSRLPLNLLAYGDPGAPHGAAYQSRATMWTCGFSLRSDDVCCRTVTDPVFAPVKPSSSARPA